MIFQIPQSANDGPARKIAFSKINGGIQRPGVLYIPGFMATGTAVKAVNFMKLCEKRNIPCIRYDIFHSKCSA